MIGILAARGSDIATAEDALSDALHQALTTWPEAGIPDRPEAWLIRVARNRMTDAHRRALKTHPIPIEEHDLAMEPSSPSLPADPRLALMFVCAHPAIGHSARTPLMLQAVLGFTAADIARAYVASPAALSKTLTRAKARIKANNIAFALPEPQDRPARLGEVIEAIYGCYALVWTQGPEADSIQREAVFLADLLATEMPDDPEVLGLSALLAFLHSRRDARQVAGHYVPLSEQDTARWDHGLIHAADARLKQAFALGAPGRFQIEAAIQAVHAARAQTGQTDWQALLALYTGLVHLAPTLGAEVGRAMVAGQVHGAQAGLAALDALSPAHVARFQPYWATRAHLLSEAGQPAAAEEAYRSAISLTHEAPARAFLMAARARLQN
nr:DUF6596 domain-containing protein [Rubricella aquisinus]